MNERVPIQYLMKDQGVSKIHSYMHKSLKYHYSHPSRCIRGECMVIVYIIAKNFNFALMINFYHYCFCVASYSAENIIFIILPNRAHSNGLTIMAMN